VKHHAYLLLPWVLAALACGENMAPPRPQWLVVVTTDAVVPLMGDRLRVELLDQEGNLACPSCRREAEVVPEAKWPVSFGIASPSSATEVYVRAQLYRDDRVIALTESDGGAGEEGLRTTLDFLGVLPKLSDGVNRVGVHLVADCLGKPVTGTLAEGFLTCASAPWTMQPPPTLGPPREDLGPNGGVGTTHLMPREEQRGCPPESAFENDPRFKDMACVPGGLFFMGSALAPVPSKDVQAVSYPQRLVAIRSFLIDRYEVTVGEFKQVLGTEWRCDVKVPKVWCYDGTNPNSKVLHCTFSPTPSDKDDLPMNCLAWEAAHEYCAKLGKRLPTEVEWEYAASNGMKETRHPWGNEPPQCESAYVARGIENWRDNIDCRGFDTIDGPVRRNDLKIDETEAPDVDTNPDRHTVFGLAGNVSEWTKTLFSSYAPRPDDDNPDDDKDPRCWVPNDGPLLDLVDSTESWCSYVAPNQSSPLPEDRVADSTKVSVRGGSWRDSLQSTWSASRNSATADSRTPRPEIGFRCVRDTE
jgi:formylglycine-generating enzyme required for sulfatase activity